MIVAGAIGDAYGAGFEFGEREKINAKNTVTKYETHPFFEEIKGRYTDDTQMSIAIAELLLSGEAWTSKNIANKFVEVFKRDPRRGYAKRFYQFLMDINDGQELLDKIHPKSERNGAVMRSYPLGILTNEIDILEKTRIQASVTHQTEKAIYSAQAIALTSHYFLYEKGKRTHLLEYLKDVQKVSWEGKWDGNVGVNAIETVEAVLSLLLSETSLKETLRKSIEFGGDVDTVASLTMAIGNEMKEIENDLPAWLFEQLENDQYGLSYLEEISKKLMQLKE